MECSAVEDGAGDGEEVVRDDLWPGEGVWRLTGAGDEGAAQSCPRRPGDVPAVGGDHPDRSRRETESPDREVVDLGRGFQCARLIDGHDLVEERRKPGVVKLFLNNRKWVVRERCRHQTRVPQDVAGPAPHRGEPAVAALPRATARWLRPAVISRGDERSPQERRLPLRQSFGTCGSRPASSPSGASARTTPSWRSDRRTSARTTGRARRDRASSR